MKYAAICFVANIQIVFIRDANATVTTFRAAGVVGQSMMVLRQ
jgi:hypothetical protein